MVATQKGPGRPPLNSEQIPTSSRILQVASQIFMDEGYDAVSMDRVAKACGVTKAVVYYYFTSKSRLFTDCMIQTMENVRRRTLDILSRDEPLHSRLLTITQIRMRIDTPLDFNSIMRTSQSVLSDEQIQLMHEAEMRLFDTLADSFAESIEEGTVRPLDPRLAARLYMALLMLGKSELGRMEPSLRDPDATAARLMDLMWHGIAEANDDAENGVPAPLPSFGDA